MVVLPRRRDPINSRRDLTADSCIALSRRLLPGLAFGFRAESGSATRAVARSALFCKEGQRRQCGSSGFQDNGCVLGMRIVHQRCRRVVRLRSPANSGCHIAAERGRGDDAEASAANAGPDLPSKAFHI